MSHITDHRKTTIQFLFMSTFYEKQKCHAAAWILRSLCKNSLWFDDSIERDGTDRNYLYIPLFNIAESSKRYDLNTLKEACYFLRKNNHLNIWGDDFDPRAMLVQVSDEGIEAHKKSFYGNYYLTVAKRKIGAITGIAAAIAIVIGVGKYTSSLKHAKYQQHAENRARAS